MNLLLFPKTARADNRVSISNSRQIQHLTNVMKSAQGQRIRVGEINGLSGHGRIIHLQQDELVLDVELVDKAPMALPCSVILSLPRPQQYKRILLHLASLGVKEIHLIQSERVEKNYWQSPVLRDSESYLLEGLEQAKDTIMPEVYFHQHYREFIHRDLPELTAHKQVWLAQPDAGTRVHKQSKGQHVIIIGPEGGFVNEEVHDFIQAGAKAVSLGSRILKTETAIPVMLGALLDLP